MISLCMIVKNEEKNLKSCLEKAALFVDEIVIVDTGSKDRTIDIAKKFTDKIYNFSWCNDFSKARNFSIEKASKDWILILDADEFITKFDIKEVKEFIKEENIVGRINVINLFDNESIINKSYFRLGRLFNRNYFKYIGKIHEQLTPIHSQAYEKKNINIEIEHIGYIKSEIKRKNKIERNISLIKNSIKEDGESSYLYYQLGKIYYTDKNYKEASNAFGKAIEMPLNLKECYVQDLMESYGYTLINIKNYNEALKIKKFEGCYKNSVDFQFLMGLIFMNNNRFTEAAKRFYKCLELEEGKVEGVNSFLPNYNLGVIFETLGYVKEAEDCYKKCAQYDLAKERLKNIDNFNRSPKGIKKEIERLINLNYIEKARKILEDNKEKLGEDIDIFSMKAIMSIMENNLEEAEKFIFQGLNKDKKNFDLNYNLAYIYEIKGLCKEAISKYKESIKLCNNEKLKDNIITKIEEIKKIIEN
ncbi:glycosyl transferase [Clostridium botulinum]|uniref:TPR domain-containing glycosyltransferase n=2 Tax=Clostridium botulinum TaxID=1491 RepID=UPI001969E05A|nr:TPR domain-containing glycosyltransferase [Clostridium botulinum]MBN3345380.1 glycosyl transferase [Clostridium botulinum]